MTEIYFNSFPPDYLRPGYPLNEGRFQATARTLSPYVAALAAGLASLTRTVEERAAQPASADGFVWLLKVLSNRLMRGGTRKHRETVAPAPAAEARTQRRPLPQA